MASCCINPRCNTWPGYFFWELVWMCVHTVACMCVFTPCVKQCIKNAELAWSSLGKAKQWSMSLRTMADAVNVVRSCRRQADIKANDRQLDIRDHFWLCLTSMGYGYEFQRLESGSIRQLCKALDLPSPEQARDPWLCQCWLSSEFHE